MQAADLGLVPQQLERHRVGDSEGEELEVEEPLVKLEVYALVLYPSHTLCNHQPLLCRFLLKGGAGTGRQAQGGTLHLCRVHEWQSRPSVPRSSCQAAEHEPCAWKTYSAPLHCSMRPDSLTHSPGCAAACTIISHCDVWQDLSDCLMIRSSALHVAAQA